MLYPVYVHKDPESSYGVTFPDFPVASRLLTSWRGYRAWRKKRSRCTSKART